MTKTKGQRAYLAEFKFRPLKKGLRLTFRQMREAVESGRLPDKTVLTQFVDEVTLMTSYPGFGDEFYEPFLRACQELLELFKADNQAGFAKQLALIHTLKKECHGRFK